MPVTKELKLRCLGADTDILDPGQSAFEPAMTGRTGILDLVNAKELLLKLEWRNKTYTHLNFVILKVKLYVDKKNYLPICKAKYYCGFDTYDIYISNNMKILKEFKK